MTNHFEKTVISPSQVVTNAQPHEPWSPGRGSNGAMTRPKERARIELDQICKRNALYVYLQIYAYRKILLDNNIGAIDFLSIKIYVHLDGCVNTRWCFLWVCIFMSCIVTFLRINGWNWNLTVTSMEKQITFSKSPALNFQSFMLTT